MLNTGDVTLMNNGIWIWQLAVSYELEFGYSSAITIWTNRKRRKIWEGYNWWSNLYAYIRALRTWLFFYDKLKFEFIFDFRSRGTEELSFPQYKVQETRPRSVIAHKTMSMKGDNDIHWFLLKNFKISFFAILPYSGSIMKIPIKFTKQLFAESISCWECSNCSPKSLSRQLWKTIFTISTENSGRSHQSYGEQLSQLTFAWCWFMSFRKRK